MDSNGHAPEPTVTPTETPATPAAEPSAPAKAALKGRVVAAGKVFGKRAVISIAGIAVLYGIGHFGSRLSLVTHSSNIARSAFAEATEPVTKSWMSFQAKVNELDHADDENKRLREENANLKLKVETLAFGCQAKNADAATEQAGVKLSRETGSKIGRTVASFNYHIPDQLPASQLYALGVSYFKAGENEKAAAIFSALATTEDSNTYKNARDLLMTGVVWYRVDNYDLAEQFFDQVLSMPETPASLPYQAKARAWKGLVSERRGKHFKAQYWLRELIDHHPRSAEAGWVNGGAHGSRSTASAAEPATEKQDASSEP